MNKYAMKQTDGKYINIGYNNGVGPLLFLNSGYAEYFEAERSDQVFYLKNNHFLAAYHEDAGKGFEPMRNYTLIDTTGTQYVLDWKNKKMGDMCVISVPIARIIKRDLPDHMIPELWKRHRQVYIDHISIKVHPHDFCCWRFEDKSSTLTQVQSICLDEVDYAVKRYISNQDKTAHFLNNKVISAHANRNAEHIDNTILLITPLVMDPLEEILTANEVYEVLPRFHKAKEKIQALVNVYGALPAPQPNVLRFTPPEGEGSVF